MSWQALPSLVNSATPPVANEVVAVTEDFYEVLDIDVTWGRRLGPADELERLPVAIVGHQVARNLGLAGEGGQVASQTVVLGSQAFAVIGVLDRSPLVTALNFAILIPASTASERFGAPPEPAQLAVTVEPGTVPITAALLPDVVTYGAPGEISIRFPGDLVAAQVQIDGALASGILAIGLLAMVVGALGITNVMMLSVLERRREIGIRRALGHTRSTIAAQFMMEALLIGTLGAVLGAAVAAATVVGTSIVAGWTVVLHPLLTLGAIAAGVGMTLAASAYPAWRASRLEPLDALRGD